MVCQSCRHARRCIHASRHHYLLCTLVDFQVADLLVTRGASSAYHKSRLGVQSRVHSGRFHLESHQVHLLAFGSRHGRRCVVHPASLRQSRCRELRRIVAQTALRVLTQHDVLLQVLIILLVILQLL